MITPFVPADFNVPEKLETDKFRLRMLKINDVIKDYDAVISCANRIRGIFGNGSQWPSKDLTLEQDLIDLGWHQKEFQIRSSFTYTVMNLDESQCLGCLYIFPSKNEASDAEVFMWVRENEYKNGLDNILFDTVKNWLKDSWPFKNVSFPGRLA